jgi:hypothetical protein
MAEGFPKQGDLLRGKEPLVFRMRAAMCPFIGHSFRISDPEVCFKRGKS